MLFEEFKGVLTGSIIHQAYLSREDYLELGVKQSIFQKEERIDVYDIFERYLQHLKEDNRYDSNILSYDYLAKATEKYDYIIVDEIQDFTNIQLYLILSALKEDKQFLLCGDSNQIVHPNFFSWSKIKTLFYQESCDDRGEIMRILTKNYRNSPEITKLANTLLKIKNKRFGSIDKESNYLVDTHSSNKGTVRYLMHKESVIKELNEKTKQSIHYAVIVINEEYKEKAKRYLDTPLIFTVQEAKGLEYDNVILYNFIASHTDKYRDICQDVTIEDLQKPLKYARVKDKTDRSMEIYKFYINALYVAVTRGVKNIYLVEDLRKHPLLDLVEAGQLQESITLDSVKSSLDDWQKEARKLEMQGKQEQAEEIKKNILKNTAVPWDIMDSQVYKELQEQVFVRRLQHKKPMMSLLEYAITYNDTFMINQLLKSDFKAARNIKKAKQFIAAKYYQMYTYKNSVAVMQAIGKYGIDFRNQFNQTPLMVAADQGNVALLQQLIENGANPSLIDNMGHNAYHLALRNAYFDQKFAQHKLAEVAKHLSPSSVNIRSGDQMRKIDAKLMEFFMLHLIVAISHKKLSEHAGEYCIPFEGFSSADFLKPLVHFPHHVLLERRKKRNYISSILSKNEVDSPNPYSRKLFVRVRRGVYILNPTLAIKIADDWRDIYHILNLDAAIKTSGSRLLQEQLSLADVVEA